MYFEKGFTFPMVGLPTGTSSESSTGLYAMPVSVFDDFVTGTPLTPDQVVGTWAVQGVNTETIAALAGSVTGEVTLGTSGASDDTGVIRSPIPIQLVANKPAAAMARIAPVAVASQNEWFGLMQIGSNTPLTSTNFRGAGFAIINGEIRFGASSTAVAYTSATTAITQVATAGAYLEMVVLWTGAKLQFYLNRTLVGESSVAPTGVALYPQVGVHTTSAAAKTMTVDYIGYSAVR